LNDVSAEIFNGPVKYDEFGSGFQRELSEEAQDLLSRPLYTFLNTLSLNHFPEELNLLF